MITEPQILHRVSRSVSTRPVRKTWNSGDRYSAPLYTINTYACRCDEIWNFFCTLAVFSSVKKPLHLGYTPGEQCGSLRVPLRSRNANLAVFITRGSIAFFHEESRLRKREREGGVSGIYSPTFLSFATIISPSRVTLINHRQPVPNPLGELSAN